MYEAFFGTVLRLLPLLVSAILSGSQFTLGIFKLAIEYKNNQDLCPTFEDQKQKGWPCLRPGATSHTLISIAISFSISLLITAYFSKNEIFIGTGIVAGILLLIASLVYPIKPDTNLFRVTKALKESKRGIWNKIGEHPIFYANASCIIIAFLFQYSAIYI